MLREKLICRRLHAFVHIERVGNGEGGTDRIGRKRTGLSEGSSQERRGVDGVEFVVSDSHPGLKKAIGEVLPEAVWQRCHVHFLRHALDYLPRKTGDDCLQELRWLYAGAT